MAGFDRAAIEELYAYTGYTWASIVQAIRDAGEERFIEPAPGSGWPTLRDCLGHIVFAYDRWLGFIKGVPMQGYDPAAVASLDEVNEAYNAFRAEFKGILDGATDDQLYAVREVTVYDDEQVPYSTGELLTHLLLHERGHAGDVTTLFYQLGIEADVLLEYRFHLGRHTSA